MQALSMPRVKKRLSKQAEKVATERWPVKGSAVCGSSLFSGSEGSKQGEQVGRSRSAEGERHLRYGEARCYGSKKSRRSKPDIAASFVRRPENSSASASSGK